jgi:hypothetical protein
VTCAVRRNSRTWTILRLSPSAEEMVELRRERKRGDDESGHFVSIRNWEWA